jgi:hypothetical protein
MRTPAAEPANRPPPVGHSTDFSLVLGGPLFQLLLRAHLSDDALMMARQRVVVIALLAWLPLLVLSPLEGRALAGDVAVPFVFDVEVQTGALMGAVSSGHSPRSMAPLTVATAHSPER